jgi:hypothetical protein
MAAVSLLSVAAQILGSIAQGSPGSVWEKIRCFGIMYACIHMYVYTFGCSYIHSYIHR